MDECLRGVNWGFEEVSIRFWILWFVFYFVCMFGVLYSGVFKFFNVYIFILNFFLKY